MLTTTQIQLIQKAVLSEETQMKMSKGVGMERRIGIFSATQNPKPLNFFASFYYLKTNIFKKFK